MEVVTGPMSSLLPKLEELLKKEYKLKKSVKRDIKFLQKELMSMHADLRKVAGVPPDQLDEQVEGWASEVRELSYDMEDAVNTFMVRIKGHEPANLNRFKGLIKRAIHLFKMCNARHQMANMIKDKKDLVQDVANRRGRCGVDSVVANTGMATVGYRLSALVGIDEATNELIERLSMGGNSSKQQLKIVSIVGFGGLGKTTLANVMYRMLKVEFDCGAFVSVSRGPDTKKVFKDMLSQLDKEKYKTINEATRDEKELIDELREFLQNKRYFIVLDDIWDIAKWEIIRDALVENNYGSTIIITTRIVDIAKHIGGAYELKPLSPDNSKMLFYRRIFGHEDNCSDKQLDNLSHKIIQKCGHVPLAIIMIASLLASKPVSVREWSKVYNSIIGYELENSLDVSDMRHILSLSYYDLPYHLKPCLLYISIFPENYEIRRDRLIWKWIAEGFVHGEQENLFELGESYFNELIKRSMIQLVDIDFDGSFETCRVHDMVLGLISSLSSDQNIVAVLDNWQCTSIPNKVHKSSLQVEETKVEHTIPQSSESLSHVRSLTVFPCAINSMPPLSGFRLVRLLDLEGCHLSGSNDHLKYVGDLSHLRYLGLRETDATEIPKEIGNQQLLQTLDLRGTHVKELPSTIIQLRHLLCLYVDSRTRLPSGVENLKSLQELAEVGIDESPDLAKELGHLTELRVLEIRLVKTMDKSLEKVLLESLCNLKKMKSLSIFGEMLDDMQEGWFALRHLCRFRASGSMFFSTLPAWINPLLLSNLSDLDIMVRELRQEDLEKLGKLPVLRYLNIILLADAKHKREIFMVGTDVFQCLRVCKFCNLVAGMVFPRGEAMPMVQFLQFGIPVREIKDTYGDFNWVLGNLPSLEQVLGNLLCDNAKPREVNEAEAALRRAASIHPNHPILEMRKIGTAQQPRWQHGD